MEVIHTKVDLAFLNDKAALITGGASGIGLATARAWAAAVVYVTIADIQPIEVGQKLAAELSSTGGRVNYCWCDVTNWNSQIAAFKSAITFSPSKTLDIVTTFAGTASDLEHAASHILAVSEPSLAIDPKPPNTRNIEVNLIGVYYTSYLALYYLRLKPRTVAGSACAPTNGTTKDTNSLDASTTSDKSLILVASMAAYIDSSISPTYAASKFGVRGLFRSTRTRTLEIGVRCNLLAPWFVDTPLLASIKNDMASKGIDMAKVLSFVSIESCVEAASFCAINTRLHGT
jgi:5'-hydroxyaverantin dehydrogenase